MPSSEIDVFLNTQLFPTRQTLTDNTATALWLQGKGAASLWEVCIVEAVLVHFRKAPHRCEATHKHTAQFAPSFFIPLAWLEWTRLFLLCYGRLCCCCCCSCCCRCSPSGCLTATDFRTVVWFSFYTLAEKQRAMCTAQRVEQDCACVCVARDLYL